MSWEIRFLCLDGAHFLPSHFLPSHLHPAGSPDTKTVSGNGLQVRGGYMRSRSPNGQSRRLEACFREVPCEPNGPPHYGGGVLELSVDLDAEQVLQECERRGLVVRSERELGGCKGGRHWHLHIPGQAGTLEMNECRGRVSLKVHPRRDGGWASTLAAELHNPRGNPWPRSQRRPD